ncbi:MAG: ribosome biogenesis GTPase YlqF [Vampirovibrionia bacterium]
MPTINWYPGHIAKAERRLKELANLVDVVVMLVDARIPQSSYYDDIENLIGDKPRLLLINKADLAEPEITELWKESFESKNETVLVSNCTSSKDVNKIIKCTYDLGKPKIERLIAKGRLPRAMRIMIMGMPNVGKSSLINRLVKCSKTKVGPKAGVTRSMQWVRINPKVELLDTPGIIPMKLSSQLRGVNLAIVNSVGENAYDPEEIAKELVGQLWELCPDKLKNYYNLQDIEQLPTLEDIAKARNFKQSGGEPDVLRCAQRILSDFRSGKIGKITLENSPNFKVTSTSEFRQ